ncbi:MAG: alpha/beta hydrolase, partial [Gammaproteobacteria bacterium]|nr:alpha/beta hydrolase [Gammaproteobacteria bacterium]
YHPAPPAKKRSLYTDRFPVVVMLQGARVDRDYYSSFGMHLARYGFVVVIPNNTSPLGENFTEGVVMQEALEQMRLENGDPDSPVYGLVDGSKLGISGHSFGGAAALYTITGICGFPFCNPASGFTRPPELKAAALVGTSSRGLDIDSAGIPVAITSGDEDSGSAEGLETYATLEPPKAFITVHGTNHFGMTDIDAPPGANADRGEPEQIIPQAISAHRYARWSGLFLRAHIYNDKRAWRRIYRNANHDGVTVLSQYK